MSWETVALGNVANVGAGNSAPQDENLFLNGTHNFYRTSDVGRIRNGVINEAADKLNSEGIKGLRLHPKGTILFPKSGASTFLNHRVILGEEGYVSSHLATIKALPERLSERFLLYFLSTIDAKSLVQDSNYPSLKTTVIEKIPTPLPPLLTQQNIVAKIDAIFAEIDKATAAAEANAKNAEALFQSYLRQVFSRDSSWIESTLGTNFELYQPRTISTKDLVEGGKYQVYGANGVIGRYDKYNHEDPQLLVTCRGATCGAVNISSPFAWINGNAMVVKPKTQSIDLRFTEYFFRGAVDLTKAITGAAQPQITRQSLSPIKFSYPPIAAQQEIVEKLDAVSAEISKAAKAYTYKVSELPTLKQTILKRAFAGELVKE